jgi:hypothetical protein
MQKIIVNDTPLDVDKAIIIATTKKDSKVQIATVGKVTIDLLMDLSNTLIHDALNQLVIAASNSDHGLDENKLRNDLYEKAVMGFSLMLNKFHPSYVNDEKWGGLTTEAILKTQNKILQDKVKEAKEAKKAKKI